MATLTPQLQQQITQSANLYGVPPALYTGLIQIESTFNQNALSPAGAIGYAQLMPKTAKGLGVNPYDPQQNLDGGAKYLAQLYAKYKDWTKALSAYNTGYPNSTVGSQYAGQVMMAAANQGGAGTLQLPTQNPFGPNSGSATKGAPGVTYVDPNNVFSKEVLNGITVGMIALVLVMLFLAFYIVKGAI